MKIRYTIDFPKPVINRLSELARKRGISKAEILRQAIALYSYVYNHMLEGNSLSITKDDKILKDIVILEAR